jgi:hypothetical protein
MIQFMATLSLGSSLRWTSIVPHGDRDLGPVPLWRVGAHNSCGCLSLRPGWRDLMSDDLDN